MGRLCPLPSGTAGWTCLGPAADVRLLPRARAGRVSGAQRPPVWGPRTGDGRGELTDLGQFHEAPQTPGSPSCAQWSVAGGKEAGPGQRAVSQGRWVSPGGPC
ncbi:Hypothetical predicted protein [Marmota monax]|uniref:Uncharacterized protein n=1 Tax=Marmota monax TaxID=9995 RepID=A0A5E4C6W5_MARMO|nr:Hypothetical predicted protein [Marmota monax]